MTRARGEPSAEFRLVAACCRWPTDVAAIRAAASAEPLAWPRVVRVARRHRVIGFVRRGLTMAGLDVPRRLDELYRPMLQRNLLHYAEAARLAGLLADAGIPVAFLKGVVLAELAYADQGVKQTVDNDILVAPHDVPPALALLDRAGYRLNDPRNIDGARLPLMIDLFRECQLVHRDTGALVDLHWRMQSLEQLAPEPVVADEARMVTVEGKPLPTILGEAMMIYLAIHGARHSWARIKWLADFNALLVKMDDASVAAMRDRAARDGVGPCIDSALIQCERRFGTPVPPEAYRSRRARALVWLADRLIFGPDETVDQHLVPGRYMRVWLASAAMMKTRPRFLAHVAWDIWVAPRDMLAMPLPRPLRPLYVLISPVRRVGRLAARGFARARSKTMRAPQEK
ncbi:nucleotidyltransferase family protein [Sphingomonas sp.]|uniref:nucleotidyltransferase family protein n=1 Tax=Sphingomonas sp. TaxID=28214 RepID=UPI0025D3ECAD|nr:nucleotidyltransferase family protein [Sphingomonas sp.]